MVTEDRQRNGARPRKLRSQRRYGRAAAAAQWVDFVNVRDSAPQLKHVTNLGVRADRQIEALREKFSDPMVRGRVIEGVNHDLAVSALGGAAISMRCTKPLSHAGAR